MPAEKHASTMEDLLVAVFDMTEIHSKNVTNNIVDCMTPMILSTNPNTVGYFDFECFSVLHYRFPHSCFD